MLTWLVNMHAIRRSTTNKLAGGAAPRSISMLICFSMLIELDEDSMM